MNIQRILIVVTVAVVFLAALFFGIGLLMKPDTTQLPNNGSQPNVSNNNSSNTSQSTSYVVPQALQNEEAVRAAFLKQQGNEIKVGKIAISGGWALLNWTDDPMGGQAVLKYDGSLTRWVVIDSIGGAYSVAGLHAKGVPQKTILALLKDINE